MGFIISESGIEADTEKIKAIQDMPTPRNVRDVQRLSKCLAYLGKIFVRMGEKVYLLPTPEGRYGFHLEYGIPMII